MTDTVFDLARTTTQDFAFTDSVLQDHAIALECRDCEEMLERGLRAYKWLMTCDESRQAADARGLLDYRGELYEEVTNLFRQWLESARQAERWILRLEQQCYTPANLSQFLEARESVVTTIEDRDWLVRSSAAFHALAEE